MKENKVDVFLDDRHVGTLAETPNHLVAFACSDEWLKDGFDISPFSLPVAKKVYLPSTTVFSGLWGAFADSLPDTWGQLLVDRMLKKHGHAPETISTLERLAVVGASGMGALTYRPAWNMTFETELGDLDKLAAQCRQLLNHEEAEDIDRLFHLGGSSVGARPKVMTEEWIIKLPASNDMKSVGQMEKAYMDCAADCGIRVPESRMLPSKECDGYFAVKRFDRRNGVREHVLTAAAILEADWRTAALDYHTLMKLTKILSRNNEDDLMQMFRRMCFNVYAHNRDDHAKNFSWIYDFQYDCWHPSPAYDLTWSSTYFGEHTTTVDGNGRDPGEAELLAVGKKAGISLRTCKQIIQEIREKAKPLEHRFREIRS